MTREELRLAELIGKFLIPVMRAVAVNELDKVRKELLALTRGTPHYLTRDASPRAGRQ